MSNPADGGSRLFCDPHYMTYIITTNSTGADFDTYCKVADRVQPHAHGRIAHYAGMNEAGLAITTIWESKAHSDRFATEHLLPALQDIVGCAADSGPGIIVGFDATDEFHAAAPA